MSGTKAHTPRVVIVGAGLAGISAAINLKTRFKFDNITIYEKAAAVGGTWRDNTYPGCGSDVPGHWYSLSSDLNPNWDALFATQPELRAYWEGLWHKYDLARHTVLNTAVVSSEWSNEDQRYNIELRNMQTGAVTRETAEVMFFAIGGFQGPLYPSDIPGREDFKGEVFHSAAWRHDVLLKNKRVAVIGNGCSSAQLVPQITHDPSVEVTNFCRTPNWFVPRGNYRYPSWVKWIFANVPLVMRAYRNWLMARSDIAFLAFRKDNKLILKITRKALSAYIRSKAPKDQLDKLIPNYAPGCKRMIVDPDYLDSLHRPNVKLCWDAIERVVENGIKLKTGEIVPFDVIIFATGYSVEATQLNVRGSHGTTMREYFESKGGPTAYLGSCVPGFPNLYILLGPNVASGHASVIFSEEAQINFATKLIEPIIKGKAKSFEVKDDVTDRYNDWLQGRLQNSVWTDCVSYYQAGRNSKTRIIATFPGPLALFWWFCRNPKWEEFRGVGAEAWEAHRRSSSIVRWTLLAIVMSVVARVGLGVQGTMSPIAPHAADKIRLLLTNYISG